MNLAKIRKWVASSEQIPNVFYTLKWLLLAGMVGTLAGTAAAGFLVALAWVTSYRELHTWIIAFLPLAGLLIGLVYHYWGQEVVRGNNQLLEEFHSPKKIIPLQMAPLVLFGTLVTHLFGGSAGREGTAVQMGGAIADQFTRLFRLKPRDRKILLIIGISAGFAAVFGTPLAGAVFALEVLVIGRMRYEAILPAVLAAVIADLTCHAWEVSHSNYIISLVPALTIPGLLWAVVAGAIFGLAAMVFSKATHFWSDLFQRLFSYSPFRPLTGGVIIAAAVWALGTTRYIGLGLPTIAEAFANGVPGYDFILKLLFTSFTLGAGFKGGEVTPLFFVGATLGNALHTFIPLPIALLAGMGFVAVFCGATNTPMACTIMGMELFGAAPGVFVGIACVTAYLFSGHSGIYSSQIMGSPKHLLFGREKGKSLAEIRQRRENKKGF